MIAVKAFTAKCEVGLSRTLKSSVWIAPAFDPDAIPPEQQPYHEEYVGIWDTGATASVITQKVVDQLALKPTGMARVNHAHGIADAEVYLVNIWLPNKVGFNLPSAPSAQTSPALTLPKSKSSQ